jgi:hypothetical protein
VLATSLRSLAQLRVEDRELLAGLISRLEVHQAELAGDPDVAAGLIFTLSRFRSVHDPAAMDRLATAAEAGLESLSASSLSALVHGLGRAR